MKLTRWDTREVIFKLECNTWEELLKGALKQKISFFRADFRYSNFSGSDFRGSDFRGSNFSGSNFSGSDFRGSDFRGSDFSGSKHYFKIGNMQQWHSMQLETYQICFNSKILCIGCKQHTIEEWKKFTDKNILNMDGKKSLKFWKKWKEFIFQAIELTNN